MDSLLLFSLKMVSNRTEKKKKTVSFWAPSVSVAGTPSVQIEPQQKPACFLISSVESVRSPSYWNQLRESDDRRSSNPTRASGWPSSVQTTSGWYGWLHNPSDTNRNTLSPISACFKPHNTAGTCLIWSVRTKETTNQWIFSASTNQSTHTSKTEIKSELFSHELNFLSVVLMNVKMLD